MGSAILNAIIKVVAKNPALLESLLEAGMKLALTEIEAALQKKANTPGQ